MCCFSFFRGIERGVMRGRFLPHWNTIRGKRKRGKNENTLGGGASQHKRLFFFLLLFYLFSQSSLTHPYLSPASQLKCVAGTETKQEKVDFVEMHSAYRSLANRFDNFIHHSETLLLFSVQKAASLLYSLRGCSGSAIQEMSLPWSFVESSHKKLRGSAVFNPRL